MLSKVISASFHGIDGYLVTVEVDISPGLPSFSTVGLPDRVVTESKDRVSSAIKNSGFSFPTKRITVNLAPSDIKKEGVGFDLPIAVSILSACGTVDKEAVRKYVIVGQLALDGTLRPTKGILPISQAVPDDMEGIIVPYENTQEAAIVGKTKVYGVRNLRETVEFINGNLNITPTEIQKEKLFSEKLEYDVDFSDVKGQNFAKRALEVAAAGAHNVLMIGPPGTGKSMLAKRIPTILPLLSFDEAIETTKIHSVVGFLPDGKALISIRPFRTPHHTISDVALIGGGSYPKPGEVSLAHNGVLFLDELPEFHRDVLEALRQPLADGTITISRAHSSLTFPANFMLVAAMNPCPCGFYGHPEKECICNLFQIQKYLGKISGPLLDRIDIHLEVPALKVNEIIYDNSYSETSKEIRKRIVKTREIQKERFKKHKIYTNSKMNSKLIKKYCVLTDESKNLLSSAIEKFGLSARAYDSILKVARTISDLSEEENIGPQAIAEAIQYRFLHKKLI